MPMQKGAVHERLTQYSEIWGSLLVDAFHYLALFAIGAAIVWSAVYSFIGMTGKGHASIEDILLLFIYLELGAMVGIYFKTNHMPVRFLIYVAITALTRMLLAVATLVIRYGSARFPSSSVSEAARQ